MYARVCVRACLCVRACACTRARVCVHARACMHMCVCVCVSGWESASVCGVEGVGMGVVGSRE